MRYLLDTHAFLWWDTKSSRLSARAFALCQDKQNTVLLSLASIWEIQLKVHLGKLKLSAPLAEVIRKQREENEFELLPIELSHILGLASLPDHHKDPFDRMLIAQAIAEGLILITHDQRVAQYPVQVVW